MRDEMLKTRTRAFAVAVLRFIDTLPTLNSARIVAHQLGRAGGSVGANHRRARRAQSSRDFIAKLKVVEEEADEALYWLEVCGDLRHGSPSTIERLTREADEITAMTMASIKTMRSKQDR